MSNKAGARHQAAYEGIKALGLPKYDRFEALAKSGNAVKYALIRNEKQVGVIDAERNDAGYLTNFKFKAFA